jgi:hypothetical protein
MAYRDNGDGTVTDLNTGFMWQQGDSQNGVKRSKDQAVKYCASLDLANHSDWRLPTIDELTSLVDVGIAHPGPTINTSYFPECRSRYYWSSSRYMQDTNLAWHAYFTDGIVSAGDADRGWHVRCVRGGPDGSVGPAVTIKAADPTASEPGIDKGRFVISRTGNISKSLTVYYQIAGTAKNGVDYKNLSGKITIPVGNARMNLYVKPLDDKTKEPLETVKVTLLKKVLYKVGSPATAKVNIADND